MNTKKTIVALAIAMAVAFVASVGMASAATLYADQDSDVGTVNAIVSLDGNTVNIMYTIIGTGWQLNATHLHVACSLDGIDGIPQTKKHNPIPGQFEYSEVHDGPVTEYTYYNIPVPTCKDNTLYIAAHAEVARLVDGVWQEETAWAGIAEDGFEGKNWATYFTVLLD